MSLVRKLRVLRGLGRAVILPSEPSYLILYVNNVCNLRCDMCLAWDRMQQRTDDLTLEEFQKLARSFRNLVQLTITGGEPTLNRDLPRIIEAFYRHSQAAKCNVITNGTYPQRVLDQVTDVLRRCPHLDLRVNVSLDGPREVHERIRGVPGCFDKSADCLDRLTDLRDRTPNLSVSVTSVISKYNWDRIIELYELVQERFRVDGHNFLLARGTTKEKDAKEVPLAAYRAMREVLAREENRSTQYLRVPLKAMGDAMRSVVAEVAESDEAVVPCVAGRKFIEIYSNGDVVPCEIIESKRDPSLGNVREFDYDIVRLLQGPKAVAMRRFIHDTQCRCTFECAIYASLAFNPAEYPRIAKALLPQGKVSDDPTPRATAAERHHPGLQPA